jgi:hypothetical protein
VGVGLFWPTYILETDIGPKNVVHHRPTYILETVIGSKNIVHHRHTYILETVIGDRTVIFLLFPSDNHDTRSTCPTSVFTGTGQSDKR